MAAGAELQLVRSWARWRADHGTYALVDSVRSTLVLADPESGFGIDLDEVESYLEELRHRSDRQRSRCANGSS